MLSSARSLLNEAIWTLKSTFDEENKSQYAEHKEYLAEFKRTEAKNMRLHLEESRKSIPCNFNEEISFDEFCQIIYKTKKRIRRIKNIHIEGATVLCTVESQTGYSTWDFYVDFNDWGHITGEAWRKSDNLDSNIPKCFENIVSTQITELLLSRNAISGSFSNLVYSNLNETAMLSLGTSYKPKPFREVFMKKRYANVFIGSDSLKNEHIYIILSILKSNGFVNIKSVPIKDINSKSNNYIQQVAYVTIDGTNQFQAGTRFQNDVEVVIYYHEKQEITAHFSGKIFKNQNCYDVENQLHALGFSNITLNPMKDLVTGWIRKEYNVYKVFLEGKEENTFRKNKAYKFDINITIKYHSFKK